jgi:outer membrane immunogenic protein
MKKSLSISIAAIFAANAAFAGSLEPVVADPVPYVPVAPMAADWSGFYVGATGGFAMGDFITDPGTAGEVVNDIEGWTYGGFAGYNFQSGDIVYGAELGAQMGDLQFGGTDYDLNYLVDARVRVGYAMGDALIYAVGGYSFGEFQLAAAPGTTGTANGWNLGAGLEYNVTDNFFVGGEYVYRDMSGDYGAGPTPIDVNMSTVQVRAGFRF